MNWLRKLLCKHKWKIIDQYDYERRDGWGRRVAAGTTYVMQCEHCGNIISKDVE